MSEYESLGTGEYEVYFKTRGGQRFVCRARNFVSLSWGRKMNDISEATVTIALNDLDPETCACVATINPWEHEMAVFRNGVEVWVGPVVNGTINLATLEARYMAKDLSVWFDHRWIELRDTDVEFEEAPLSDVFTWLIGHAYYKQPWNMTWDIPKNPIPIDRIYTSAMSKERWAGTFQSVGQEMRDLSKSGIDTTTVRRKLIGGDLQSSTEVTRILADHHWAELPSIEIVGSNMATEVGVGGGNGGYYGWYDDQIWIERASIDDNASIYGLLQSFYSAPELDEEDTTGSPNAIRQQAYSLREVKKEPFVYMKGGSLGPKAPVTPDELIPGNVFQVQLVNTCRQIQNDYRLFSVAVDYGPEGEKMSLELTPLGADKLQ